MRTPSTLDHDWNPGWAGEPSGSRSPVDAVRRLLRRLDAMVAVSRQRRELLTFDDRMLKDIGVTRADVQREANRRFWDIDDEV